jgi:hypothetical protein
VVPPLPRRCGEEEAFWAEKKAVRREMRARKWFLEAKLDNPNSMLDINENSLEWDDL